MKKKTAKEKSMKKGINIWSFPEGTLESAGGKLMCYEDTGAHEIKIEKETVLGEGYASGNISDLGGYYSELLYLLCELCLECRKKRQSF